VAFPLLHRPKSVIISAIFEFSEKRIFIMKKGNPIALLPILVFLVLYLGCGIIFEYVLKIPMGFYNIPIVVVFLVAVFCAGYCIGFERAEDVYCNGTGTESVSNELEQAGTNISNAEAGIGQAENHAGNVEAGIGNAQESADYLQGTVSTSTELIGQCQSIIERIRSRGETETK
jgi:hypothetical protein